MTETSRNEAASRAELAGAETTLVNAVNLALDHAMTDDPDVVVLGEDIGRKGGVFCATEGLLDRFGPERVMDTPVSEAMIGGLSVGLACQGVRPVAEFQFLGFIFAAMEQIACHASRMRTRTRGRLSCPIVFRAPFGAGIHGPEHHSESTEALFAHLPGLRVVIPSSPARAYGLLLASIRDPDPVVFLEPKRIYRTVREPLGEPGEALPLDRCFVLRKGHDITLITWGAMVQETLESAEVLAGQGISAEVIDVATVKPIDFETIRHSVSKTGRCVIVHEAARSGGIGGEIAALLAERAFHLLEAPVARVTGYDTVVPYYRLERSYLPSTQKIIEAVSNVMAAAEDAGVSQPLDAAAVASIREGRDENAVL